MEFGVDSWERNTEIQGDFMLHAKYFMITRQTIE